MPLHPARVVERQTLEPQKLLPVRACGFESRSGHSGLEADELGERLELLEVVVERVEEELPRSSACAPTMP